MGVDLPTKGEASYRDLVKRSRVFLIAALVSLSVLSGAGAAAQETNAVDGAAPVGPSEAGDERARVHHASGTAYYESGAYDDALREWEQAYQLSPRPELLYNFYLAHRGLGNLEEARSALRRYLDSGIEIDNRETLEQRVENLDRQIAARDAQESEPGEESAPSTAPSAPEPEMEEDAGGGVSPVAIAGFVGAGIGLAMATTFGIMTLNEDARLAMVCPCEEGAADTLRRNALLTDIGFGIAAAGLITGLVFLFVGSDDEDDEQGAQVSLLPWLSEENAGLILRGRL